MLATQISTAELIAILAAAAAGIALVAAIGLAIGLTRLRRAQRLVLGEHGERDLVAYGVELQQAFALLRDYVEDIGKGFDSRLSGAELRLDGAVTHHALVRYDAYN